VPIGRACRASAKLHGKHGMKFNPVGRDAALTVDVIEETDE
jgi:hypothetical protein